MAFASNPKKIYESVSMAGISRNRFPKNPTISFTCKPGELVPCLVLPVVPGDNVMLSNILVARFPALAVPAFVPWKATTHYFYVSNRVVWPSFDEWFEDTAGETNLTVPRFTIQSTLSATEQRFLDFFGIPPIGDSVAQEDLEITAYEVAAFQKVYNDWYRPRPFQDPVAFELPAAGGNVGGAVRTQLLTPRLRSWEHDYHSSMLPEPMVAPEVNVPMNIVLDPDWIINGAQPFWSDGSAPIHDGHALQSTNRAAVDTTGAPPVDFAMLDPDGSLLGSTTVNQLREAYARMRYLEKMGRVGGEYYEVIQALYNVKISDARLQRSEYITGSRIPITINPVLATAESDGGPIGQQAGHMVGAGRGGGKMFHVEEHGTIICIFSMIPDPVYKQGIPRHFRAFDREDYIIPDMEHIGEQAVLSFEINAYEEAATALTEIGYLPNYQDRKEHLSRIAGEFRDSLSAYVVTKEYSGVPTLDLAFVQVPTNIADNIFVVDAGVTDPIWINMIHNIVHETCLSVYSDPI